MKIRINKLISDAGVGSRREAEQYILDGRITINGKRAKLTDQVQESDIVMLDDVDLPIRDLIKENAGQKAYNEKIGTKTSGYRGVNSQKVRAEQQRLATGAKSAALRRTSKNNPVNKYKKLLAEKMAAEETGPNMQGSTKHTPSQKNKL